MLNLADLQCLLTLLCGPLSGLLAARDHHASVPATVLFTISGLLVSILAGFSARLFAYSALRSERAGLVPQLLIYLLVPVLGLVVAALLPFLAASLLYGTP